VTANSRAGFATDIAEYALAKMAGFYALGVGLDLQPLGVGLSAQACDLAPSWLQFWLQFTGVRAVPSPFIFPVQDASELTRTANERTLNPRVRGSSPWRRTRPDLVFLFPDGLIPWWLQAANLRVPSATRSGNGIR
jgi:hypothetical protein